AVAVRLSARDVFMPDLAFYTKAQTARLLPTYVPFAPTFVIEALSPSTAINDTRRKFAAYEFHGVKEYWILDPQDLEHRFYRRQGDVLTEFGAGAERIESVSINGFWIKRAWLNPSKLSSVRSCLAEILGSNKTQQRRR